MAKCPTPDLNIILLQAEDYSPFMPLIPFAGDSPFFLVPTDDWSLQLIEPFPARPDELRPVLRVNNVDAKRLAGSPITAKRQAGSPITAARQSGPTVKIITDSSC